MELKNLSILSAALEKKFSSSREPHQALAVLTEELGEVAAELNKSLTSGAKEFQQKDFSPEKFREELGDLILAVFHLANVSDVDLETEMNEKYLRLKTRFDLDLPEL